MDKELIKKSFTVLCGNTFAHLLGMIFMIVIARIFTKDDYGFVRYSIVIGTLSAVIVANGYPTTLARFIGKYRKDKDAIDSYFSNTIFAILILLGCTLLAVSIIFAIHYGILSVVVGLTIYYTYYGIIRGFILHNRLAIFGVGSNALKIIVVLILYYLSINSTVLTLIVFSFAVVPIILIIEFAYPLEVSFKKETIAKDKLKELTNFTFPLLWGAIAYNILSAIGTIVIEHYHSLKDVADYSVALTIATGFTFVPTAINTILMPKIACIEDKEKIKKYLNQGLSLTALASIGLFAIVYFLGKFIIKILFTEIYLVAFDVLIIISIGMVFFSLYTIFFSIFEGVGKPQMTMKIYVIICPIIITLTLFLTPIYGIMGAGYSLMIGHFIGFLISVILWLEEKSHIV